MDKQYFEKLTSCTGCGACVNACPVKALSIDFNKEGFYAPKINEEKCIKCGKCQSVCPAVEFSTTNKNKPKCYAYAASDNERSNSSSGAFFPMLAKYVFEQNGYVCGVAWNENFEANHIIIDRIEDLHKLRFSKYVQSNTVDCFTKIKKLLEQNKLVLFSGTPCQNAGLIKFLNKEYPNLITVDIICHGTPSPKVWLDYLSENFEKEKIVDINFRNKNNGWVRCSEILYYSSSSSSIVMSDGKEEPIGAFYEAFLNHCLSNKPCLDCKYRSVPRPADFTCGDFWYLYKTEMNDKKGLSAVLLNNKKAEEIFDILKTKEYTKFFKKINLHNKYKYLELNQKSRFKQEREVFFKKYQEKNITTTKLIDASIGRHYDIALNTFFNGLNYGSCLVAYAVNNILEKLGYTVINVHKRWSNGYNYTKDHLSFQFALKNYFISKEYDNTEIPIELNKICDAFVLGSDTLWWWDDVKNTNNHFWLDYVLSNKKKISFCTSFGFDEPHIPELKQEEIKYLYSRFDALSTREESGLKILKDVFDCEGTHLWDPTLVADPKIFHNIEKQSQRTDKNYIVAYILDIDKHKEEVLQKFADQMKLPLIIIPNAYISYEYKKMNPIEDFIYLLKNADFIVTDSFHGACFSTIFEKQFCAIINTRRGNARYRIFDSMGLSYCFISSFDNLLTYPTNNIPDYSKARQIISEQRNIAINWLSKALRQPVKKPDATALLYDYMYINNFNNKRKHYSLEEMFNLWLKYIKYKLLTNITFGKTRKKYKEKKAKLKEIFYDRE